VPAAAAGIAFLSGGQSGELAAARLNAMNIRARAAGARVPWPLVFSFARAIQHPALEIWDGQTGNIERAQQALLHRARCSHAALAGEYGVAMETAV
jgi:fructose-bisphosphate aldolase class I